MSQERRSLQVHQIPQGPGSTWTWWFLCLLCLIVCGLGFWGLLWVLTASDTGMAQPYPHVLVGIPSGLAAFVGASGIFLLGGSG